MALALALVTGSATEARADAGAVLDILERESAETSDIGEDIADLEGMSETALRIALARDSGFVFWGYRRQGQRGEYIGAARSDGPFLKGVVCIVVVGTTVYRATHWPASAMVEGPDVFDWNRRARGSFSPERTGCQPAERPAPNGGWHVTGPGTLEGAPPFELVAGRETAKPFLQLEELGRRYPEMRSVFSGVRISRLGPDVPFIPGLAVPPALTLIDNVRGFDGRRVRLHPEGLPTGPDGTVLGDLPGDLRRLLTAAVHGQDAEALLAPGMRDEWASLSGGLAAAALWPEVEAGVLPGDQPDRARIYVRHRHVPENAVPGTWLMTLSLDFRFEAGKGWRLVDALDKIRLLRQRLERQ